MAAMMHRLGSLLRDERGATAVEYGLIATFIAIAIIGSAGLIGTHLNGVFDTLASTITSR